MLLGNFVQQPQGYKVFIPGQFPPKEMLVFSPAVHLTNDRATLALGKLDGIAQLIPDIDYFLSTYIQKEAAVSSNIEGTKATMHDALRADIGMTEYIPEDVENIFSYINAINYGVAAVQDSPLTLRIIRQVHEKMMKNTREGIGKTPGELRKTQNWIGGATIRDAHFVPPAPHMINDLMNDLDHYWNDKAMMTPLLIKAAVSHYQFETIHPFLDGNGRIGRLLITLFLMEKKLLTTPALYISYYLKLNRVEYYDRMSEVRRTGNYEQWVIFFLQAFHESARDAIDTIDRLSALHDENLRKLDDLSKRQKDTAIKLFLYIESNPIINLGNTAKHLEIAYNTAAKTVNVLVEKGILSKGAKLGKTRTYIYEAYLEILRKDT